MLVLHRECNPKRDAAGHSLLDTTLLDIGKRNQASIELKSEDQIAVWPCLMFAQWGPGIIWTGTASGVYFSRNPEAFEPVLRALPPNPPKR